MTKKYFELGADKQLNQIVFAGSHDAAISGPGLANNVQTQTLDIAGQAEAGVRLFDIRIGAAKLKGSVGGNKQAELRAFHGGLKKDTKTMQVGNQVSDIRVGLKYGDWGLGLEGILADARRFVSGKFREEFLILKFDKCSNWSLIAETCRNVLEGSIYKGTGSLNTKKLRELSGKVIVAFTPEGLGEVPLAWRGAGGISGIVNFYGKSSGAHNPDFDGLQYYGKGGTSVVKPNDKISQNKKKQAKLMRQGITCDPEVMGMMYWTTTGLFESIKERDKTMWSDSKVSAMRGLWSGGLAESIESRLSKHIDPTSCSAGGLLKAFMPNIIMIDFADPNKCKIIYDLNSVAASALTSAAISASRETEAA